MRRSNPLPPGQRTWPNFPRFGLPPFASRWPEVPENPAIVIDGDVGRAMTASLSELASLPRTEQVSDFHCVTTWSRMDVRWCGYRFADFYRTIVVPRAEPAPDVSHIRVIGSDGYCADLLLQDALGGDVLLADEMEGEPLPLAHGAPIRLVSPAQYGYKSVRHVRKIVLTDGQKTGTGLVAAIDRLMEHPRARVQYEERSQGMPGWVYRRIYRAFLPAALWYFRRHDRNE
ncbi:MAG: molybdopterin-dependent oxidoreductase [Hyphomicrobiaceae bacterium]